MTYDGGKPHKTGDEGQRYEISFKDHKNTEHIMGWVETIKGAEKFQDSIGLHPNWHSAKVTDRLQNGPLAVAARNLLKNYEKDIQNQHAYPVVPWKYLKDLESLILEIDNKMT